MNPPIKNSLFILSIVSLLLLGCNNATKKEAPNQKEFVLLEKTISELQELMTSGDLSSEQITHLYIDRIEKIDRGKSGLNAVIELNPEALDIARKLDTERAEGDTRGPLHGIPVLIKDNIDTGDKMSTSAGSIALKDSKAENDAFIVSKLREAGAVLLGKTNLSEWANFRSFRSSSGWSSRGGQTKNPYYLDRNPCGSSSGSGVAVSANLCAIAIGTETNGSIVCPSSVNGVVGIKPTVGLWSRSGIIPISETQDTAGPMARTVTDAVILLGELLGSDPRDSISFESVGRAFDDYTQFLDKNGMKDKRIGVLREKFGINEKVDSIMNRSIRTMKEHGAIIIDSVEIAIGENYDGMAFSLLQYEFKDGLNKYLQNLKGGTIKSLEELIAFNEENREMCMPYFEQEILKLSEEKSGLDSKEYQDILESMLTMSRKDGLVATLDRYQLDAIVAPTNNPSWPIDLLNGDKYDIYSSSPAARSGYPNITVPAGNVQGLPVGISFFSRAYEEPKLISMAFAFEQATHARIVPKMLETFAPE
ncbi:MAG: amidase [Cyclobacteriaceae bacterium]